MNLALRVRVTRQCTFVGSMTSDGLDIERDGAWVEDHAGPTLLPASGDTIATVRTGQTLTLTLAVAVADLPVVLVFSK